MEAMEAYRELESLSRTPHFIVCVVFVLACLVLRDFMLPTGEDPHQKRVWCWNLPGELDLRSSNPMNLPERVYTPLFFF